MMNISASPLNLAVPTEGQHPTPTVFTVSNEEFIKLVFRDPPEGNTPLVCSKSGDPTTGGWLAETPGNTPNTNNNYLAGASFRPVDGEYKNRKEQATVVHFLMLDDLGGKIPLEKLAGLKLSWLIKTSPGNFQGGIIFKGGVSPEAAEKLLKATIKKGLSDPGATGAATRWARLPNGINGKEKYRDFSGKPFSCRLVEWRPEQRYTIEEIWAILGLEEDLPTLPVVQPPVTGKQPQWPLEEAMAKCREIIQHIPPDVSYDDWIAVGMAIWFETGGHYYGAILFDEWSAGGAKYPGPQEVNKHWRSFRPVENPRTFATLVMIARKYGYGKKECEAEVINKAWSVVATIPATTEAAGEQVEAQDELAAVQKCYGLLKLDSKYWVVEFDDLGKRNSDGGAAKLPVYSQKDGLLAISRFIRKHYPNIDIKECCKEFMLSPETRVYTGVEFSPVSTSAGLLNLWVGPTIKPQAGDWERLRGFLLNIICSGEQAALDYLLGFLAHALQRPDEKPGVMVILLGGQGIGKGTLATILRRIWTATFLQVYKVDDITGNFNASLERAYVVFMDEALFVGDRKGSDALKSLVTESLITINEKYQPARQIRSFHRFFAATNAQHFKNTESDDRRDFVLRVSEVRQGDREYWNDLYKAIEAGEVEALAQHLLEMDLTGFSVRDKPDTAALLDQKLMSLEPIARWWYDCLVNGEISGFVGTKDLTRDIMEMAGYRIHKKPTPLDLINSFRRLCPSAESTQKQFRGQRQRGITFPPLALARKEFEAYIGSEIAWPVVGADDFEFFELPGD